MGNRNRKGMIMSYKPPNQFYNMTNCNQYPNLEELGIGSETSEGETIQ